MTWPTVGHASLGWGAEYWDLDPSGYEGWEELRARGQALGKRWSGGDLALELADNLLSDVLVATGGVEHSLVKLRAACVSAQQYYEEFRTSAPQPRPQHLGHPIITEAWYEFANFVSWVRALDERLDRRSFTKGLRRQGLVPALRPKRLRKRVDRLIADLRAGPLGETRFLANYTLHAALIRHPFSGASIGEDGRLRLPIPDQVRGRIYHERLLTWKDGRDGLEFAEEVWRSIEFFVDALLDAFEKAIPRRLRRSGD